MTNREEQGFHPTWLRRWSSKLTSRRSEPSQPERSRPELPVTPAELPENVSPYSAQPASSLRIAAYSLVLMDPDGQVIWTREWDSGGVFEFRPRQHLIVFCGYTNHSAREAEVSEYEIELMSEDGAVIERFGSSFGDAVIIPPGESKNFSAEWRM